MMRRRGRLGVVQTVSTAGLRSLNGALFAGRALGAPTEHNSLGGSWAALGRSHGASAGVLRGPSHRRRPFLLMCLVRDLTILSNWFPIEGP